MAHTPGPWDFTCEPTDKAANTEAVVVGPDCHEVCFVYGWREGEVVRANARLIASAPDLLAACVAARDYIGKHEVNDANKDDPATLAALDIVCRLTAAISKAKGGA